MHACMHALAMRKLFSPLVLQQPAQRIMLSLSYLGSKKSLLPFLESVINPLITPDTTFCDYFMGSGCVSNHFKKHPHVSKIIAGDMEVYSYVFGKALLNVPFTYKLAMIIDQLNNINLASQNAGIVERNFASGDKLFFSKENAARIDLVRISLSKLYHANKITYDEFLFLLASLLVSASACSNTCGTFRAHLKHLCARAKKKFKLLPIHHDNVMAKKRAHVVKKCDAVDMAHRYNKNNKNTIVYLDPPYNACHYGAYYSFLNYLCIYDGTLKLNGTGILDNYNKSKFGLAKQALQQFSKLFNILSTSKYIILSYSSEGVLGLNQVIEIAKNHGSVTVYKIWYKSYKSKQDCAKRGHVIEYIIVVHCGHDSTTPSMVRKMWLKL